MKYVVPALKKKSYSLMSKWTCSFNENSGCSCSGNSGKAAPEPALGFTEKIIFHRTPERRVEMCRQGEKR